MNATCASSTPRPDFSRRSTSSGEITGWPEAKLQAALALLAAFVTAPQRATLSS